MIYVRVLGTTEVRVRDRRITPDSEMLFALALFLSLNAGRRIPRSFLLDLFWPSEAVRSRRHALRQLLYRLHRSGFSFKSDGEEILIDEREVESDIRRVFVVSWPQSASPTEVESVAQMLSGYDPPLPKPYRDWLDELRARVHSQYRRALLYQIEAARRDGRWHDVEEWAGRGLAIDPLNEEATLARAEALAMSGSKAQALRIIDGYLYELGDRDRVIGLPAKTMRRRVSENAFDRTQHQSDSARLIGREREFARLNDALIKTLPTNGTAILVTGAAGIGKTRLANELFAGAALRGWRTIPVRLHAGDIQRPLSVFVDLFSILLEQPGALGCAPASLAQLRILAGHVESEEPNPNRSQEAEAVQDRLRLAGLDLLESVVSEGPLVLLIDDLHWCDERSIRLLSHLISRSTTLPLFWILTARLEAQFVDLRRRFLLDHVRTMRVGPLARAEAATLFEILRKSAGADALHDGPGFPESIANGNPLFIQELARREKETGNATSLPDSLRSLIRDRITRLSPVARNVLHACAILGRHASIPRIAGIIELNTPGC